MRPPLRVGVLASGSGTNLQALLDACGTEGYPAKVAGVICNIEGAKALERAKAHGVAAALIAHKAYADRAAFEKALVEQLQAWKVELVCLAGFMRVLGPGFLRAFPAKVLNIHPSLLPAFPGLHAQRQALQHGVRLAGCTVHFVDEGTDTGPIFLQAAVPVLPGDDEAALSTRIQAQEHLLYPLAVKLFAEGRARLEGRVVIVDGAPVADGLALRNPGR